MRCRDALETGKSLLRLVDVPETRDKFETGVLDICAFMESLPRLPRLHALGTWVCLRGLSVSP